MKKIITILLLLLFLSSNAEDSIKLPVSVSKKVAKELVSYDSLKAIHKLTEIRLSLTEQKVEFKDTIISNFKYKDTLYEERIKNEKEKFIVQEKYTSKLEKQNKRVNAKFTFVKVILYITSSALAGLAAYTIITH